MFHFFQHLAAKTLSVLASAIIAVGIVKMPQPLPPVVAQHHSVAPTAQSTTTLLEQAQKNSTSSTSDTFFNLFGNKKKNNVPKPIVNNFAGLQQTTTDQTPQTTSQQSNQNLITCNGQTYNDNCALVGKKFVCYSNAFGCYTESDINNMFVCNNNAYLSCSLKGQKDVCSSDGVASCVNNTITNSNPSADTLNQIFLSQQRQKELDSEKAELAKETTAYNQMQANIKPLQDQINALNQQINQVCYQNGILVYQGEQAAQCALLSTQVTGLAGQIMAYQQNYQSQVVNFPTALCNDGTESYSAHNSGTCSDHNGVYYWFK
jgi:hypothetical protein